MKLDKRLVDKVIELTKKYYRTNDTDYIPSLNKAMEVLEKSASWEAVDLVYDLARYTQVSGKGTYDDIYKALSIFGIIVKDKEIKK